MLRLPGDPPPHAGLRFPALVWSLLHAPLVLALYWGSIQSAVAGAPPAFRWALWPTYPVQALVLGLFLWLLALPSSAWPGLYQRFVPLLAGLATVVAALDSRIYAGVGFHLNGFFFRVLAQRNALKETGVPLSDVALFLGAAVAWIAFEWRVGGWFLDRYANPRRRAWAWALALLLLGTVERFGTATLTFYGGQAIFAAGAVLPLTVPVRIVGFLQKVTGEKQSDPFAKAGGGALPLPPLLPPEEVRFERKPDVVLVLAESLPAAHLDPETMPRLWARAAEGARFTHHYAGASSTNYTLFSLIYGIQAQKLDATVGAGRQALLFPALQRNGYQPRVLAASCVDWMGLKETVFGPVAGDTTTWCEGVPWEELDGTLIRTAREWVGQADDRPIFLLLFMFGTHFNYHFPEALAPFKPYWDGEGGLKATSAPGPLIQARARNAAHYLDARLDALLREIEARRGRTPVVLFTGDHGEEFRQKGHLAHGSDVTDEQVHVPMVVTGPGVPTGVFENPTSHVDLVPTLFALLGDRNPPARYSDGLSMFAAPPDRFVLTTVGWEPHYAVIGKDLKVKMYAGFGAAEITDLDDRPLPDGEARMAASTGRIMRAMRGEADPSAAAAPSLEAAPPATRVEPAGAGATAAPGGK